MPKREMSEENHHKCCVCQKQFSASYNLNKHARRYHPEQADRIIPKKTYNYQCTECHKNFSLLKSFNYHKRTHNHQQSSENPTASKHTIDAECPICKLAAPKDKLISHFEAEHDIKCVTQTVEFTSFEEFSTWKTDMQHRTKSAYVVERGSQSTRDGTRITKYCCHRSGKYVGNGKGLRHLKMQGSKKIGGFCPARIKLTVKKNNQCKVSFTDQHVGHGEDDLEHLFLTDEERKSLANKVALKIPFTQILDDVRDSITVGSELERIHLVNRKDLANIERKLHSQSTELRHEHDAVSDDVWVKRESSDERDSPISEAPNVSEDTGIVTGLALHEVVNTKDVDVEQFASEKQKVIDNFTLLMKESVTSMEQLDAVRKMCTSLGPTLKAIATKQQLRKPSTSVRSSSPSNKKIASQCGKLRSNKKKTAATRAVAGVPPRQMIKCNQSP